MSTRNLNPILEGQLKTETPSGFLFVHQGHKVWELDLKTATITQVVAEKYLVFEGKEKVERKKIDMKPFCLYCSALNKKNAERRFIKMLQNKPKK